MRIFSYRTGDVAARRAVAPVFFLLLLVGTVVFAQPVSDDFSTGSLNTGLWTFVDPLGDGQVSSTATQAVIDVPAGLTHEPWKNGNTAPRIMQSIADVDFEVEVKFESTILSKYQEQGLVAHADDDTYVRMDFFSDGSRVKFFAATFNNGSVSVRSNVTLGTGVQAPLYMRMGRVGDVWTQSYSYDGQNWTTSTSFTYALPISEVGVFAGNFSSSGSSAPAQSAIIDYFFNTVSPLVDDGGAGNNFTLNRSVVGDGSVSVNPDQVSYADGSTVLLTATPAAGWQFDGWSGDASGTANPLSLTVSSNLNVVATFSEVPVVTYDVSTSVSGSGTVTGGGSYADGSTVLLTATPAAGWQFDGWSGDASGTANPLSLTVSSNLTVVATFSEVPVVTYDVSTSVSGSGTVTGGGSYADGSTAVLTATPAAGWQFDGWSGDASGTANPLSLTVSSNLTVVATFSEVPVVTYDVSTSVSGSGTVTGGGSYADGSTAVLTATPAAGWQFDGWSGDASGTANPLSLTVSSNLTVVATFSEVPVVTYDVSTSVSGSGTVTGGGSYADGSTAVLTATPAAGWQFDGWSGDASGTANPLSLTVSSNLIVTAVFSQDLTPPEFTNVALVATSTAVTVSWTTDEPTTGVVRVGSDTSYALGSISSPTLQTSHSVSFPGLFPDTLYHLEIEATNFNGLIGSSGDITFTTMSELEGPVSDDFSTGSLNTGLWTFVDPLGDGQVSSTATQVVIDVPAGLTHEPWKNGNTAPRIMQSIADVDFEVEVKYESTILSKYHGQGLVAHADDDTYVRMDFFSDGSRVRLFAATFNNGSVSVRSNVILGTGVQAPLYMRMGRVGDVWTQSYSYDGQSWTTSTSFTYALPIGEVGVFASNFSSSGSSAPAQSAIIDYFFNTASPLVDDSGAGNNFTLNRGVVGDGSVSVNPDQVSYADGSTVLLTASPAAGWQFDGWSGDASGTANPLSLTVSSNLTVVATFSEVPVVTYDVSTSVSGSGTVTGGGSYADGSTAVLTATPAAGWQFDGWSGDASGTANPLSLTVSSNLIVTAVFSQDLTPPEFTNVALVATSTAVTVSWTTDEPTTGVVRVGSDTSYALGSISSPTLQTSHSVSFPGLFPDTLYHLEIEATNFNGLIGSSGDITFTTMSELEGPVSDDFSTGSLNTGLWTFVDPLGDGQVSSTATQVVIDVPAGLTHEPWKNGNTAPRIMQSIADVDFEVEVKYESTILSKYHGQGLVAHADDDTYVRMDFFSDGSRVRLFAATFNNGSVSVRSNVILGTGVQAPLYMRMGRVGDVWTQSYSYDGQSWTTSTSFTYALPIGEVGVFASNFSSNGSSAPAQLAIIDYFFNTASPLVDDGGAATTYQLTVSSNGNGTADVSPDKPMYEAGETVALTATPDPGYRFENWTGDNISFENPLTLQMLDNYAYQANFVFDFSRPYISNVDATSSADSIVLTWDTTGQATSIVRYGLTPSYELGSVTDSTLKAAHSIALPNLEGESLYYFEIQSESANGLFALPYQSSLSTGSLPFINVWYGEEQTIGQLGIPQPQLNIPGTVSDPDGLSSLSYSLNGGAPIALNTGPFNRLSDPGDFNLDIDISELLPGSNLVVIQATDDFGNQSERSVSVEYVTDVNMTLPLTVSWDDDQPVPEQAKVVDGQWYVSGGSLRPHRERYDRIVAIGERQWTDYEVEVPITVFSWDPAGFNHQAPGFGFLMRWDGHTDWSGQQQPDWGWYPTGGGPFYRFSADGSGKLDLTDFDQMFQKTSAVNIQLGVTYLFKAQVESVSATHSTYRVKVWEADQPEPAGWTVVKDDVSDVPSGSLLLIAHFADVAFGNVVIRPLP